MKRKRPSSRRPGSGQRPSGGCRCVYPMTTATRTSSSSGGGRTWPPPGPGASAPSCGPPSTPPSWRSRSSRSAGARPKSWETIKNRPVAEALQLGVATPTGRVRWAEPRSMSLAGGSPLPPVTLRSPHGADALWGHEPVQREAGCRLRPGGRGHRDLPRPDPHRHHQLRRPAGSGRAQGRRARRHAARRGRASSPSSWRPSRGAPTSWPAGAATGRPRAGPRPPRRRTRRRGRLAGAPVQRRDPRRSASGVAARST